MSSLDQVLDQEICKELREASNHATRQTIIQRVVLRILGNLGYPVESMFELKNLVQIHRDCAQAIERHWQESFRKIPPTQDEINTYERFMSKDFVRAYDLGKLVVSFSKRIEKVELWKLLAVDGMVGDELKHYTTNLRFTPVLTGVQPRSYEEAHVRAVRAMYHAFPDLTPERLARMMYAVYDRDTPRAAGEDMDLAEAYMRAVGDFAGAVGVWKQEQKLQQDRKNQDINSKKRKCADEEPEDGDKRPKTESKSVE